MFRIYLLLISLFFYAHAWADPSGLTSDTLGQFFTLSPNDPAVQLLANIFGPVSDVLWDVNSTPRTPLNSMFGEFNNAMLVLSMIILIYGTFFGIINTAHEGDFLGKARNSLWVPIRSVFSVVLLIPNTFGYCILQVIVMWIVLQGSGAADRVWDAAVDSFVLNGPPKPLTNADGFTGTQAAMVVSNLFQAEVCVQMYTKAYLESTGQQYTVANAAPPPTAKYVTGQSGQPDQLVYNFQPSGLIGGSCGSYSMLDPQQYASTQSTDNGRYDLLSQISQKMPTVLAQVNSDAIQFVQAYDNIMAGQPAPAYTYDPDGIVETLTDAITDAQNDYAANTTDNTGHDQKLRQEIEDKGWIYAGGYYRELSKFQGLFLDIFDNGVPTGAIAKTSSSGAYNQQTSQVASNTFTIKTNGNIAVLDPSSISVGNLMSGGSGLTAPVNAIGDWLVLGFLEVVTGGTNFADNDSGIVPQNQDPIISLQIFGNKIISIVEFCWVILLGLSVVLAAFAGCPGANPFFVILLYLMKVAGLVMAALGILFVFGLTMSVYLPMVPYIIFFFGVVGWIVAVLEAMLSAPLVAMAMADVHHEGGGVWGRASLAFMLILGVFIRPVFMVFGLIGGMLISRMAIQLLNDSFNYVMFDTSNINDLNSLSGDQDNILAHSGIGPFQLVSYIFIYLSIVVIIVNKAFSLINTIPDQVLRWIGSSHQFGTFASEAAGTMDRRSEEGMGQIGKIGGEIGGSAARDAASASESRNEQAKKNAQQNKKNA